MNNFISILDMSVKYNISNAAIHTYISRGTIPSFAITRISKKAKDIFFNEKYLLAKKFQQEQSRKILQDNYTLLKRYFSRDAISRLCIDAGADVRLTYANHFFKKNLFDYPHTSIFISKTPDKLRELLITTSYIIKVCNFIGSYNEKDLRSYMRNKVSVASEYKATYLAICPSCRGSRYIHAKPKKPSLCLKCHLDKVHKGNKKNIIQHYHFCPFCPTIRISRKKLKTNVCFPCKKVQNPPLKKFLMHLDGTKEIIPITTKFKRIPKRYFRFCEFCSEEDAIKEVRTYKDSLGNCCPAHKHLTKQKKLISNPKKTSPEKKAVVKSKKSKKSKETSPEAIHRALERNRLHRQEETTKQDKEIAIPLQKKTDEEMKKEWLKKNKPSTTIKKQEDFPHLPGTIHIAGGTLSSSFD